MTRPVLLSLLLIAGCASADRTYDRGGVVRGDRSRRELALIFTGGEHGEGTELILDTLREHQVVASFFVTGDFLEIPRSEGWIRRIVQEGHYLGPHSHAHPLYAPWENRDLSLVTEEEFQEDLQRNIEDLRSLGMHPKAPIYFIPPYEWYNERHVEWARELGCLLFNFTPGSGSHRDWAPEGHAAFRPSRQILADVLACEARDPDGLNGHLLLLHLGSERRDQMYRLLGELIEELRSKGYRFVRVDELLELTTTLPRPPQESHASLDHHRAGSSLTGFLDERPGSFGW